MQFLLLRFSTTKLEIFVISVSRFCQGWEIFKNLEQTLSGYQVKSMLFGFLSTSAQMHNCSVYWLNVQKYKLNLQSYKNEKI